MDKALKQRLVGASVLIILAVIVLPMLLSGRSDTLKQESRQIELPLKPDELSIETRRFPVGIPDKPVPSPAQEPGESDGGGQEAAPVDNPSTAVGIDNEKLVTQAASDDVAADIETAPPAVTSITLNSGKPANLDLPKTTDESQNTPRYLVQVASFSSEKNANALASRLRGDNLPVLMDVVDRAAGRLHRVRVGPYAERFEADEVVTSISSKMQDLSPRVLDLRPTESAPVSTPSDPLVRWVVQVGSFSSSKSADALVAKLRLAGLTAFSEKVSAASGIAYKVRIGPEIDRDKAAELARQVKVDHGLDGFVTTQE